MPDQADSQGLITTLRDWVVRSYPFAVVRRFVELELLERSVALSAQAFIAMLPLVILIVSLFVSDVGATLSEQFGTRLGLDTITVAAIEALFSSNLGQRTISWLAVVMILVSAFSLARRLARVYAGIFGLPPLNRSENWRGLVWIGLQVALLLLAGTLKQVRDDRGWLLFLLAVSALLLVWFGSDLASLKLLVPGAETRLIVASALVSTFGRVLMGAWVAVYFTRSLSQQAQQYGPIGVTFALYTYLLVAVLIYVCAPLLVTTWVRWRAAKAERAVSR